MIITHKYKTAFTMVELIFVIIVLGVLASLALPRMDRDLRQDAGDNILSAIRYTQHMALIDNKTNPFVANWQKALWQIRFTTNSSGASDVWSYTIGSNNDYKLNIDKTTESAVDPINGLYMYNNGPTTRQSDESPNIFLTELYGINNVVFNNCSGAFDGTGSSHIAFDQIGRPHRGVSTGGSNNYQTYVNNKDCIIRFSFATAGISPLDINISRETGYAYIVDQNAS